MLAALFNRISNLHLVPSSWKQASIVLIYKKGDRNDPGNWRPISLCATLYKLYTACLAHRISRWADNNGILSKVQKGFGQYEGCYEHNFVLQSILDQTRRKRKRCCVAWLDLANAFPSVPHDHIMETLRLVGIPPQLISTIQQLYTGCTATVRSTVGDTDPFPVQAGVRQGCPLSPVLFNIALEPVIRAVTRLGEGYSLAGREVSVLAYADDLVLVAKSPEALQRFLDAAGGVAELCGLRFKPAKCASLDLDCRGRFVCHDTAFTIQGGVFNHLGEGESYQHLGIPTGYHVDQSPEESVRRMTEEVEQLDQSLLAPWQKIDALNRFIMPKISFTLRGGYVMKQLLKPLDLGIKRVVKGWLNLPQRASPELLYVPCKKGGTDILPIADLIDVATTVQAFRMLTAEDELVATIASSQLREVVMRRLGREPSLTDLATYLSGSLEGEFGRDGGDIASLWTRARNACRRLQPRVAISWFASEARGDLAIKVEQVGHPEHRQLLIPASERKNLEWWLKREIREEYGRKLAAKPDQGKVFKVTSKSASSNHFLRTGFATRFCDWRFIHRARLDVLPLNATRRFGEGDKRCRRCGQHNETLPHVLNHCRQHSDGWQRRHNAVQDRLVKAIPPRLGTVTVNRQVAGVDSNLRPDIVVRDEVKHKVWLVDVAVPFENEPRALEESRAAKRQKYRDIAAQLRGLGYTVFLDAFQVGPLGGWDPANEVVLRELHINWRYSRLMRKLMCSDAIRWSRDIYVEHVTGTRQYQVPPP